MRHTALAVLFALSCSSASAQDAPLPSALLHATTAAVINVNVDQDVYDRLVTELHVWKRFTLVPDPAAADITIAVHGERITASNPATQHVTSGIAYRLIFKQRETVLYSDTLKGCCSLKAMVRKTLEKLDKRMRAEKDPQ